MKLATFTHQGKTRVGIVLEDQVIDLSEAAPELPRTMPEFLAAGKSALEAARKARAPVISLSEVKLEAPVQRPGKFLAVGLNYRDHAEEAGEKIPVFPMFFNKQSSCTHPPYEPFYLPKVSPFLDYEGELGFVIGRKCRYVSKEKAPEVIAGYFVCNDVSVRDFQMHSATWTIGKSFDTHGPFGPWITTPDEVGDPHALDIETFVNGELRQSSNTKNLIFNCYALVEYLSKAFTLEPGDVVSTGTPSGAGALRKPRSFLKEGDVVRVEVERLGHIEAKVIKEPADVACS
ncbi:MAG: fumarylacetoacetate hydrolase family protein [Bdellovibrionota bacterium]